MIFYSQSPNSDDYLFTHQASTTDEINLKLELAKKSQTTWESYALTERLKPIFAFQQLVLKRKDQLALCIAQETGKILSECLQEVQALINKVSLSVEAFKARCVTKRTQNQHISQQLSYKAIGCLAVIGPFNFPVHLPHGHIIPALIAGNAVLFKPSEYCTQSAKLCFEWWQEAGLMPGVLQLVLGFKEHAQELVEAKQIDGVLFTGAKAAGQDIYQRLPFYKLLALELGGHNPLVVADVDDLEKAIACIQQSAMISTGQRCSCARRLIVVKQNNTKELLEGLVASFQALKVGRFDDEPEPFMGPLIHKRARSQVLDAYTLLIKQGAKPLLEPKVLGAKGAFLGPGLVDITGLALRHDQEVFGPLLQVSIVDCLEAAVKQANDTPFGLSSSLISSQDSKFTYFKTHIKSGLINWNRPTTGASSALPFGGVGYSGNYRPSGYFAADYCSYPVASQWQEHL